MRGDRAGGWIDQTRSEVVASRGMVATSQPLAAQVGLDVLRGGGNAADAAVATAAALSVVEPGSTHLGGDMFALYWSARERRLFGLNASGWAPAAWTPSAYGVITVPGAIDGWHALLDRFGTMGFGDVLEPAVHYAEEGFPVSERVARDWAAEAAKLRSDPDSAATFLVDGAAPPAYSVFRNPSLARALRVLQEGGRDAFYDGPIARAIVGKLGGAMGYDDLREFRSEWVEPLSVPYRGFDVHELPPNGQGFGVLEMLRVLEGFDLAALGPRSPELWHLLVEAKKLVFADLEAYCGDPRFADLPLDRLLSAEHAAALRSRIDPTRASAVAPGAAYAGGTVYLAAADRWGDIVSFIYSIYSAYGSGVTVPGYGFLLHDRGALFSADPSSVNVVAGRKRPFHTIIPAFVTREGRPVMAFGSMGGSAQVQAQATELVNLLDLGMNVQAAGDAARFRHDQDTGVLWLESRLFEAVGADLRAMGHDARPCDGSLVGGYQAILVDEAGVYRGGSDFRKDGLVAGH